MEGEKIIKLAIIAGASEALKFQKKKLRATDQDIIRHVSDNIDEIVEKLDRAD